MSSLCCMYRLQESLKPVSRDSQNSGARESASERRGDTHTILHTRGTDSKALGTATRQTMPLWVVDPAESYVFLYPLVILQNRGWTEASWITDNSAARRSFQSRLPANIDIDARSRVRRVVHRSDFELPTNCIVITRRARRARRIHDRLNSILTSISLYRPFFNLARRLFAMSSKQPFLPLRSTSNVHVVNTLNAKDDENDIEISEDFKSHKLQTEVVETTRARRWWIRITWLLTWWIPSFLLEKVGRMKRPDVRMAWQERNWPSLS